MLSLANFPRNSHVLWPFLLVKFALGYLGHHLIACHFLVNNLHFISYSKRQRTKSSPPPASSLHCGAHVKDMKDYFGWAGTMLREELGGLQPPPLLCKNKNKLNKNNFKKITEPKIVCLCLSLSLSLLLLFEFQLQFLFHSHSFFLSTSFSLSISLSMLLYLQLSVALLLLLQHLLSFL